MKVDPEKPLDPAPPAFQDPFFRTPERVVVPEPPPYPIRLSFKQRVQVWFLKRALAGAFKGVGTMKIKSWKTSLFGTLAAIGSALAASPDPVLVKVGAILTPVALALLGFFGKDKDVTGGKRQQ